MKVRLISVGRDRSGLFEPAVREYASRLSRYCRFELLELPEGDRARGAPACIEAEGEAILKKLAAREALVALDERGRALGTRELATFIGKAQEGGGDLAFVVGGADGLAQAVRERARLTLSLSAMTLPHRLARVVIAEQLYRAFTLLKGEPYHRD